jgi:hypothetical protein
MGFMRNRVASAAALVRDARVGDGLLAHLAVNAIATDANATLTIPQISGGFVQFTGFTAGRNITTPTAAAILAAFPDMDIGDTYALVVSVVTAFAGTYVAGAGVTLSGRATTPASSWSIIVITKLSATTVEWRVS